MTRCQRRRAPRAALLLALAAGGGACGSSASAPEASVLDGSLGTPAARSSEPDGARRDALLELLDGMGVRCLPDLGRLEVEGWVNQSAGLVELFACGPRGKTHESVVVLDCVPSGLHAGLLALGLEPPDAVAISVRWADERGEAREARAEDWIWNAARDEPMPACDWTFLGSFHAQAPGDGATVYAADRSESLVATHRDASAVLENPLDGIVDDTLYHVNERIVPSVGTPVLVTFARAAEAVER